jgi:hypothetical protein
MRSTVEGVNGRSAAFVPGPLQFPFACCNADARVTLMRGRIDCWRVAMPESVANGAGRLVGLRDGRRLNYVQYGDPEGFPVVGAHGMNSRAGYPMRRCICEPAGTFWRTFTTGRSSMHSAGHECRS